MSKNKVNVKINKIDLLIINNSLNEVLHGFNIDDFQSIIGATRDYTEELLKYIDDKFKLVADYNERKEFVLEFGLKELQIIYNSISKALEELEEIDYTTRIGATKEEIESLLSRIKEEIKAK